MWPWFLLIVELLAFMRNCTAQRAGKQALITVSSHWMRPISGKSQDWPPCGLLSDIFGLSFKGRFQPKNAIRDFCHHTCTHSAL
jgi:hypothetical protein